MLTYKPDQRSIELIQSDREMTREISEKILKRALRDIEFIQKQILRFQRMPIHELKANLRQHPFSSSCQIPHPSGSGHIICGPQAWGRMLALVDVIMGIDKNVSLRISPHRATQAVANSFSKLVLRPGGAVTLDVTNALIEDVLASLTDSMKFSEHYIPCILFTDDGPDEFEVGPVTFTRRGKFFRDRKSTLKRSVDLETASHVELVNRSIARGFPRDKAHSPEESRQLARSLQARAIWIYRDYPWIASVQVLECDEPTSEDRAILAVDMAIHLIRILLGGEQTRKIRHAWSHSEPLRTAHLRSDSSGSISPRIGMRSAGPVGAKNWHEGITRSSCELELLGSALRSISAPREASHLNRRLLDSISWFGDAATDTNASASIIKYTSAIERLLFGTFQAGRKKSFALRISRIFQEFDCDFDGKSHERALELYDRRSQLVHGEWHESRKDVDNAASISRLCLLCSAQIYAITEIAFGDPGPEKLEETMGRIASEGLEWLILTATQSRNNN